MSSPYLGLSNFLAQHGPDTFLISGALLTNLYSNCLSAVRAASPDLAWSVGPLPGDLQSWVARVDDAVVTWRSSFHDPDSFPFFAPYFAFDLVGSDHVALDVWRAYSSLSAPLLFVFPRRNGTLPLVSFDPPSDCPGSSLATPFLPNSLDSSKRPRFAGPESVASALPLSRGSGGKRSRPASKRRPRQVARLAHSSSSFASVASPAPASGSSQAPPRLFTSVPSVETCEWLAVHNLTVSGLLRLMNRDVPDDSSR